MLFKTLEIQGFKSFADKTVITFDTKTTAVIGFNGNGKSNISDALRWVMGEQSAKTMRGENMADVIFHGTVGESGEMVRKPLGVAHVALTIDNADRALSIDADEVVISRKLYRIGKSEYSINGREARLRDIHELLMGTGLGPDGYSVIGQGRVKDIVEARDTERRELFEEAAGVSLFLRKKADAEKQLDKAEDNIIRQSDLIRVDEERLPILKKQSEKAIKASELMAQKKELEISVSVARLNEKRGELSAIGDKLLINQGECEQHDREIKAAEQEIETLGDKKLASQGELNRARSDIQSANEEIAEKRAKISVAENDLKHNGERRGELTEQLKSAEENSETFNEQVKEINGKIDTAKKAAAECEQKAGELQKKLDDISNQSSAAGEAYSALESEIAGLRAEEARQEQSASMARRTAEEVEVQKRNFLSDLSEGESKINEYRTALENTRKTAKTNNDDKETAKNRLAGMERLAEGKRKRFEDARKALDDVNRALGEKNQRYKVLSDIEKSKVGYNDAAKAILKAGEQGRIHGIHGTVADAVTVPERYVTAIETVLSYAMQNIIVDNEETATRCMRYLKETKSGWLTFYPLTSTQRRYLNEPRLKSESGFEGIASELVECDDEYANIISHLLGLTAVVDDINTAKVIGKKFGYKFRIVTLDGQLVNAGGSFTGGERQNKTGFISRKQELDGLYSEISKLREKAKANTDEFERYKAELTKSDIEIEGMNDRIRELEQEEIRSAAEISRLTSLIGQLEAQGETSRKTLEGFDSQIKQQNEIANSAETKKAELSEKIAELEKKLEEQSGERTEAQNTMRDISEKIKQYNLDKMGHEHEIDVFCQQIKNIEDNRRTLVENSDGYRKAMEALDRSDREIRENIEKLNRAIEQSSGELRDKNAEINKFTDEINEYERRINELHESIKDTTRSKEKYSSEIARLEERKGTVQKEYDKIVALLYDSYELTVSEATEQAQELENLLAAENDLTDLNKQIHALGIINMESIEEYQKVSARYEFQTKQLEDIKKSKEELLKIIADLTEDIRKQFISSFNEINGHFKNVFVQIFGEGAHAELELTNPEDVLNSGIEIKAAPPGKVIKSLMSLSGGEQTLVAITLYFALLMYRPSPFCMLDEVDAALDAVNVEKYINYLNRLSQSTQLMIISHRRETIEGCEVLYGVVMQEKGVSMLIRRELTDDMDGVE